MARYPDQHWDLPQGKVDTWEQVQVAVLMDIRDRLDVLRCWEFKQLPGEIRKIRRLITKPKRKKLSAARIHLRIKRRAA